jgi:aerobic C4-dicarboxylate transport protein
MSECRALTNFIGNAVATVVIARWEGALDRDRLAEALSGQAVGPAEAGPTAATITAPAGLRAGEQDPD